MPFLAFYTILLQFRTPVSNIWYLRLVTLDGLKKNWEELHLQYQGLSVVTDTAPKKARYLNEWWLTHILCMWTQRNEV